MQKVRDALVVLGIVALVALSSTIAYKMGRMRPIERVITQIDTIYRFDTITALKPIYYEKRVVDSVRISVPVSVHDTTYIYLEREQVVWQDSLSIVYASGILPHVDSVTHFIQERTIYRAMPEPSRWAIGVQAGCGLSSAGLMPYVGVGIQYNLFSW